MALPTSGFEKLFRREPWVNGIRSNNCYAYAMNDFQGYRLHKSIPGNRSGLSNLPHTYTHCKDLKRRLLSDNPGRVYPTKPKTKCKSGFYKIMMFVAPKTSNGKSVNYGDFHFYKQHNEVRYKIKVGDTITSIAKFFDVPVSRIRRSFIGPLKPKTFIRFKVNIFSHKLGWATGPLLTDSCGKTIKNPLKSCRTYSYDYSKYCNSFCVRDKNIRVGITNPKVRKNIF